MYNILDLYNYTVEHKLERHSRYIEDMINDEDFASVNFERRYDVTFEHEDLQGISYVFKDYNQLWINFRRNMCDGVLPPPRKKV